MVDFPDYAAAASAKQGDLLKIFKFQVVKLLFGILQQGHAIVWGVSLEDDHMLQFRSAEPNLFAAVFSLIFQVATQILLRVEFAAAGHAMMCPLASQLLEPQVADSMAKVHALEAQVWL